MRLFSISLKAKINFFRRHSVSSFSLYDLEYMFLILEKTLFVKSSQKAKYHKSHEHVFLLNLHVWRGRGSFSIFLFYSETISNESFHLIFRIIWLKRSSVFGGFIGSIQHWLMMPSIFYQEANSKRQRSCRVREMTIPFSTSP